MLAFVPIIAGFAAHRQALFAGLATGADVRNAASSFALIGVGYLLAMVLGTLLMVWYCTNGTVGPNRFGSDPHES